MTGAAGRGRREGTAKKRAAWRFGRRAEALAVLWLRLKGYRILERNLRLPAGEIDIVARRGRTLAFIEVKARPLRDQAADALTPRQKTRIGRAARAFLGMRPQYAALDIRFDALLLSPRRPPVHIRDAWQMDDARW
jgi:putative endonuclease